MAKHYDTFWAIPKGVMANKKLSLQARVIYGILFTRMNGSNEAWPGQKSISDDTGIGIRTVVKGVKELVAEGLIDASRRGRGQSNVYSLPHQEVQDMHFKKRTVGTSGGAQDALLSRKRTEGKEQKEYAAGAAGQVHPLEGEIIDLFKGVNPSYKTLFSRKNQHEAVRRMIAEHGAEKMTSIVKFLPRNNAQPYAPKITTPIQLEEKMGQMAAFWQQEKQKGKKNEVVTIP